MIAIRWKPSEARPMLLFAAIIGLGISPLSQCRTSPLRCVIVGFRYQRIITSWHWKTCIRSESCFAM